MILRVIIRPIIVPHVPYIPHHTSSSDVDYSSITNVDAPEWIGILLLIALGIVLLLVIIMGIKMIFDKEW